MQTKEVIRITGLNKSFGEVHAVNDLSLSVREGELFAFLGVNGAGKSTTISIICGRLKKDSGTVTVLGTDTGEYSDTLKCEIGVVFQGSVLDKTLSVRDNLAVRASLYGITGERFLRRLEELDSLFGLKEILDRRVGKLSGGQRRRIDIARALIHSPKILILDEPTTGLDPQTRRTVWQAINELRGRGGLTVFLTTHYMEEAADADYIVIIDSGSVCAEGTPHDLKNRFAGDCITVYGAGEAEAAALGCEFIPVPGGIRVPVKDTARATELIVAHPEIFVDYEITKGRMDDVFIAATGRTLIGEVQSK
ncbi:MAG: ABC transporter ATP-binding protein [Clostridia bacterium]|nr:ABC transporter ATP-binding protein [Clostridia bacterium]